EIMSSIRDNLRPFVYRDERWRLSRSSVTDGGLTNKPPHSSSMPLRCANQSYSYYERNKDLDLDSQKSILPGHECFFGAEFSWPDPPFVSEKVDNIRVPF